MSLDWSPVGLSADPVPGDPDIVRRGGEDYLEVATAISRARTTLATIDLGTYVVSDAVDALRSTATEVAENITRAQSRYEATGHALVDYAAKLDEAQTEARAALGVAADAAAAADEARNEQRRFVRLAYDADDPQTSFRYEQLADARATDMSVAESARPRQRQDRTVGAMRRPTVAELELPVTVWAARARPGFGVQPLQADRTPFDSTSSLWGRRAALGLVLRNDQVHGDLETRFILARVFHADQEDDGSWWAFAYLSGLEPGWDARSIARAHERDELRRLRYQEVELYSTERPALESQAVLDRLDA